MKSQTFSSLRRRSFLAAMLGGAAAATASGCGSQESSPPGTGAGVSIPQVYADEDVFGYLARTVGRFDAKRYQQLIGAANDYKEGDEAIGVSAADETSRKNARQLLANTRISDLLAHPLLVDNQHKLISQTTDAAMQQATADWTLGFLKTYLLNASEDHIRQVMVGLTSDVIGCLVKLMSNAELTALSRRIWNPLPGSKVGSRDYLGARIQPNSPTDNLDDIQWQVFDGFAYAVGDVVLGCNPVSSEVESVASIERMLHDLLSTFGLLDVLPHCVLSHIDIQAEIESKYPGQTGIWFQSIAGTDGANGTFDVSIDKMLRHAATRSGKYGLYFETGQGADFTNGQDFGVDMVILESRKYGFARALQQRVAEAQRKAGSTVAPWVHLNDVAGFIGPEVFRFRDQLVRCCLEDIVMGKLHGLTIGLDVCSTLHMDVSLDDLDYCLDQIMPANPAYLMGLPTKNDPMLGYLTTAYQDHVRIRDKFGYKVDDRMWSFFQQLGVIDGNGKPTDKFGDPRWVYLRFRQLKGDLRSEAVIYAEADQKMKEVRERGVWLATGYGKSPWSLDPKLDAEIHALYEDSRKAIWTEFVDAFVATVPMVEPLRTRSVDRKDYVLHPVTGEQLSDAAKTAVAAMRLRHSDKYNVQIVISDGLCAPALMDMNHLSPYLESLRNELTKQGYKPSPDNALVRGGRVRAGYQLGELLYGGRASATATATIIHLIGERPGSGHHTFSAYLTAPAISVWSQPGKVDHNITRVISGIADTAYDPRGAGIETVKILMSIAPP
jgi:ethanolamine ammonia-lyase large subunit